MQGECLVFIVSYVHSRKSFLDETPDLQRVLSFIFASKQMHVRKYLVSQERFVHLFFFGVRSAARLIKRNLLPAQRTQKKIRVYIFKVCFATFYFCSLTFSAFWLRSSVVSVLCRLTSTSISSEMFYVNFLFA